MGKAIFGLDKQGKGVVVERGVWEGVVKGLGGVLFSAEAFKEFVTYSFPSQREAAECLGVSTGTVNRLCRGAVYPSMGIANLLSATFPENDFLIRLPSFQQKEPKRILWATLITALNKCPESLVKARTIVNGRSLRALDREGSTVSPKALMTLCRLAEVDVHSVLNADLPQENSAQMEYWKTLRVKRQPLFATLCHTQQLSAAKIARGTGINRNTVTDWLYEGKVPTFNSHIKLCMFFKVRFDFWDDWL